MYMFLKPLLLRILAVDPTPPSEPKGADHDSVQVFSATRAFLSYRLIGWGILCLFFSVIELVLVVAMITSGESAVGLIFAAVIGLLLATILFLTYFMTRLDYEMRTYIVTDKSLRIREGAFNIREMTLTYVNIQNVKVEQGPVQRMFGFKNLVVETAGGGGAQHQGHGFGFHSGVLRGINKAEEVRDLIQRRMERAQDSKPERPADKRPGSELAAYEEILLQVQRLANNLP